MNAYVQWNSVHDAEDFTSSEDRTRSARSVGQRLTHWATSAPFANKHYMDNDLSSFTDIFVNFEKATQRLEVAYLLLYCCFTSTVNI